MNLFLKKILVGLGALLFVFGANPAQSREDPFGVDFRDEIVKVVPGQEFEFSVKFKVPDGYYLYDDKTLVKFQEQKDFATTQNIRPQASDHYDAFFKKNLKVHFKDFTHQFKFKVPHKAKLGKRTLKAELRYQGCSKDFCYRPVKKTILLPVHIVSAGQATAKDSVLTKGDSIKPASLNPEGRSSFFSLLQETDPQRLLKEGKATLMVLALVGGIVTSFTPCVLPIIPLTLAFIGATGRRKGNLVRASILVLGMVTMYSVLGFLVASLGLKLGFLFQSRYFVLVIAAFFLIFALALFDVIPFKLPSGIQNKLTKMGGEGLWGTFLAGLTIGLIASPCVGPLIAPLLLIAAQAQDRVYGFLLLFSYGLGMGLLFLLLATGFGGLRRRLKGGPWTSVLKKGLALTMLLPAFYYGYVFAKPMLYDTRDSLWVYQFQEGMNRAVKSDKPILLDFYADWCPPCIELDKRTFSTPEVRDLSKEFIMLKIDCSFDDANCQAATERYQVVGWPTVLFLESDGSVMEGIHVMGGFVGKDKMLALMQQALERRKK